VATVTVEICRIAAGGRITEHKGIKGSAAAQSRAVSNRPVDDTTASA